MKILWTSDVIDKIIRERDNVAFSLSGVDFNLNWEPEIFHGINDGFISDFTYPSSDEENGIERLGFFWVPESSSEERISSFVRFLCVRLFVCNPAQDFFEKIPEIVKSEICRVEGEWGEDELNSASMMSGFSWMILTNGDFYYLIE